MAIDAEARAMALTRIGQSTRVIPSVNDFASNPGMVLGANGDPYWFKGGAPAYIRSRTLTPADFGIISGAAGDQWGDGSTWGLQAFLMAALTDPNYKYHGIGQWNTAEGLVINPTAWGNPIYGALDFGMCHIYALTAISTLLTITDCYRSAFRGMCRLHGTNYASDANSLWTCDVGLSASNVGNSTFDHFVCEGFGYAGALIQNVSDTAVFNYIEGTRIGSGSVALTSRSKSFNWSGATNVGGYSDNAQYTQVTVDTLPIPYVQANTGGVPNNQLIARINGRYHFVTNINPSTGVIQFFPWLTAAEGTSGTGYWVYGGTVVDRGNDANIIRFGTIKGTGTSTAYECSSLYGPADGVVDSESNGAACRIGASPSSTVGSGKITMGYCEGNDLNIVKVGLPENFMIDGRPAATPASKDVDLTIPLAAGDVFPSTAFLGFTNGAPTEGWDYPLKIDQDVNSAVEVLDFNKPATFQVPVYRPPNGIQTLNLSAPDPSRRQQFRYDSAMVAVSGVGNRMQPAQVTVQPPTGHSITYNGVPLGVNAAAVLKGFDAPALLWLYQDGNTSWSLGANNPADGSAITYNGDVNKTLVVGTDNKVQIWNTPLTAARTVTLSTSNTTNGNRFRAVRSSAATGAFNLTVAGVNLTAPGQWIEFMFDGTAWVEIGSGTLL